MFSRAGEDGTIRAYGVSNVTATDLADVLDTADRFSLARPLLVHTVGQCRGVGSRPAHGRGKGSAHNRHELLVDDRRGRGVVGYPDFAAGEDSVGLDVGELDGDDLAVGCKILHQILGRRSTVSRARKPEIGTRSAAMGRETALDGRFVELFSEPAGMPFCHRHLFTSHRHLFTRSIRGKLCRVQASARRARAVLIEAASGTAR